MQGVGRKSKLHGEFRTAQKWVGGTSFKDAYYIPPAPNEVSHLMDDLEMVLHNVHISIPHLICIGITYYQFETVHPFLDGNGRLGRLLITLYLLSNNVLAKPVLYLSDFFEKNQQLYYDNLTLARTKNDMHQWLTFFLTSVLETAQHSIDAFNAITTLRRDVENKRVIQLGKKVPLAMELIKYLYSKPIIEVNEIGSALSINISTAHRLVQDFEKLGILKEQTGYKRNRIFVFEDYLNLFK